MGLFRPRRSASEVPLGPHGWRVVRCRPNGSSPGYPRSIAQAVDVPSNHALPPFCGSSDLSPQLADMGGPPAESVCYPLLRQASRHALSPASSPAPHEAPTPHPHLTPPNREGHPSIHALAFHAEHTYRITDIAVALCFGNHPGERVLEPLRAFGPQFMTTSVQWTTKTSRSCYMYSRRAFKAT
jgi:hypothetical protein